MPNIVQQYFDPYIYNSVVLPGNASAAVTLRAAIEALAGGEVPPKTAGVVAFAIVPAAAARVFGGYNRAKKTFATAVKGGGYEVAPIDDKTGFDISDPLDAIKIGADGAGASTCTLILYRGASPS